jgi:predicted phage tail protein
MKNSTTEHRGLIVRGGGGGGSSSDIYIPIESADTLRSKQYARIIDALGEGEIVGLINGAKSIFLDDTPLQDEGSDGVNFPGVVVQARTGTQYQTPVEGFPAVESEIVVAVKVTATTPVVRSIINDNIDAVRVTLRIPALMEQHDNGDVYGAKVTIGIDINHNGGGWQPYLTDEIVGKTTTVYRRAYRVGLSGTGPWQIRMRRLVEDATSSRLQNETWWDSYTEIIDAKLSYPNTALVALQFDAEAFQRIPVRGFHARGRIVKVPSNYDPETRVYTGEWNGTFKSAWTDNPAWAFHDIVTNDRPGLGDQIDASQIDKWGLYAIARYCDELVPDGFGGWEPRFSIFFFLQQRDSAYAVLTSLASVFRAITYWAAGQVTVVQDRPGDVVAQFTSANVVDGHFRYEGSSMRARHTVALVTWNDPADRYRQVVEAVVDDEGVARYGVNETEVVAVGCKSRGQAHRFGKWLLYSERFETETVTFRAGLDAARVFPGAIIQTMDAYRSGKRYGGRIKSATTTKLTIDAPVTLEPGLSYSITAVMPSGTLQTRAVAWAGMSAQPVETLTMATALPDAPLAQSIWVMAADNLVPETWRVIGVTLADEPGQVDITAIAHHPGKFAAVEENIVLEPRPTTTLTSRPNPVTGLKAETQLRMVNSNAISTRIAVGWIPSAGAVRFVISWRRDNDNWKSDTIGNPGYDIDDVPMGLYTIRVVAVNALGRQSNYAEIQHVVGNSATAPDVKNLRLNPAFDGPDCPLAWDEVPGAVRYQIMVFDSSGDQLREAWSQMTYFTYTYALNIADGGPRRSLRFAVTAYTLVGHSANPAVLEASNPAPATPKGIIVEAGPGQVGIEAERPTDEDLVGMIVWMHVNSNVPTTDAYKVYQGADNSHMQIGLQPGIPMYFKLAFYDRFGTSGLNISNSFSATPTATGGIRMVTSLPNSPEDVGGDLAVFLDVEDDQKRGLWGWDGSEWKFTRDGDYLVANSVTASKMAVEQLSAISANLGTMTAGNFTLNATGWIKGGATSWSAGTGLWMGYDGSYYKWRVGQPGGSGASWDGTTFRIYGPDGSITIQSGSSLGDFGGYSSWSDFINSLGPITAANIGTIIPTAAIGAAQIGSIALVGTGNFSVKSAAAGARMEMDSLRIVQYDANNNLRILIGKLT